MRIYRKSSNAPSKTTPPPNDYTFRVAASQVWTDTGLDLEPGDRVHIYGKVMACEGPKPSEKAHLPLPSAPGGALLAKLHGEANPILASPDADLPIIENSRLYLGVNDNELGDNSGTNTRNVELVSDRKRRTAIA